MFWPEDLSQLVLKLRPLANQVTTDINELDTEVPRYLRHIEGRVENAVRKLVLPAVAQ